MGTSFLVDSPSVDRRAYIFWIIIGLLLAASAFFARGVAQQRAELVDTDAASLSSGQVVELFRVVDGDTVIVRTKKGDKVVVRLLGIKAFEHHSSKDPAAPVGKEAVRALEEVGKAHPLRVMLGPTPQDRHGRTIATLIGQTDVGLALVRRGLALVYSVYPYPALPLYLEAQGEARSRKVGLWGDAALVRRADALEKRWAARAP